MAAHNADQDVCLVLFPEVSTETALSILNCFHILTSYCLTALNNHGSMSFVLRKLRLIWPQISTTDFVLNVKPQKIEDLENCVALCLRQSQGEIFLRERSAAQSPAEHLLAIKLPVYPHCLLHRCR